MEKKAVGRPKKLNSEGHNELERVKKQCEDFEKQIEDLNRDQLSKAPTLETEPQTKLSQDEIKKDNREYLKPVKVIMSYEKFNERFRKDYEFGKEMVNFIAENKELPGERIEVWTKCFPGVPAEFWIVPVNKPVWAPRYLAEQIRGCQYHTLSMQENQPVANGTYGMTQGQIVAKNTVHRLNAEPVTERKSIFMGDKSF